MSLKTTIRMVQRYSLAVLTMPVVCLMSQLVKRRRLPSMTHLSKLSNGSRPRRWAFWLLAVGTKRSRYPFKSPVCTELTRISTGILDHKLPSLPSNYQKDVIPLTYNTLCSLLERLSATYRFLISTIPLLLTRFSASAPMTKTYLAFLQTITSPLKWQTRVVSCFTAAQSNGFAVGSIEGRVAIQ